MSLTRLRPPAPRRRDDPGDAGLSLIELIVAMMIFGVVLAIYFGALISMANTTRKAQTSVDASDALRATFNALDHQVRYASSVNRPVQGGAGRWYVEFEATKLPNGAPNMCYQWRFDPTSKVISYRTWSENVATVGPWRGVAWDVVSPGSGSPFVFSAATPFVLSQSLTVTLRVEGVASAVLAEQSTTFVARNSSNDSITNKDNNGDGVSDTEVCTSRMDRP